MSIHIELQAEQSVGQQRKKQTQTIEPLLLADPSQLYQTRARRLQHLAAGNPLSDYLQLAALIASAQHHAHQHHPLPAINPQLNAHLHQACQQHTPPLDSRQFPRTAHWRTLLDAILNHLRPQLNGEALKVADSLAHTDASTREQLADALLGQQFSVAGSDKAPFIWAALSLYWLQTANHLSLHAREHYSDAQQGEARQFCPLYAGVPVAGVIHGGARQGLRYLHCTLCESQWHVVRIKCSNCEQTGRLNYWSLDSEQAAIKCESCDDCGSYLKLIYQNSASETEPVADDLASLILDIHMEQQGYARSAFNPLLFPNDSPPSPQ